MAEATLELKFKNDEDKTITIRVPGPREDITAEEIKAAMDLMMEKNIFLGNYRTLVSKWGARIVTKDIEDFNVKI